MVVRSPSLPFPSLRSSRPAALALAASLGFAALAPTMARAETQEPDKTQEQHTTWSRSASRSFFDLWNDNDNPLLHSPASMKAKIRSVYNDLDKKKVNRIYRDYVLGVLNGDIRYDHENFITSLYTSPRIHKDANKFLRGATNYYTAWHFSWPQGLRAGRFTFLDFGQWRITCMECDWNKTNNQWVAQPGYSNVWRGVYYGPGKQFNLTLDEGKNVNYSFASYLNLKDVEIDQKELDLGFGDGWDVHSLRYRVSHKLNNPQSGPYTYRKTVKSTGHDSYLEVFTDRASSSNADYMLGGFWLSTSSTVPSIVPFYFIADQNLPKYGPYTSPRAINYNVFTGQATYKGVALGYLQTNHHNRSRFSHKANEYWRLTGSVKLKADFGNATQYGKLSGKITDFKLDGVAVNGKIDLNTITDLTNTGKVKNHTYGGATGSINGIIFPEIIHYSGTDYVDGKHVPRYEHFNKYRVDYSSVEGNQPSKLMGVAQGTSDSFPRPDDDRYTFDYEYHIIFGANKADPEE